MKHFKIVDPALYRTAMRLGPIKEIVPADKNQYFSDLAEAIVNQQLSGKAANTIWTRVLDLFPKRKIEAKSLLKISDEKLRGCGLSFAKARYIKDLASRNIDFSDFSKLSTEEIRRRLMEVKGIGPWTAEMFLMFTMGKPDVFSPGDQGLKNAIKKLPGLKKPEAWSPYRSYACRILWRSLDNKSE